MFNWFQKIQKMSLKKQAIYVLFHRNKKWVMWLVMFYTCFIQAQQFKYKVMFREPDTWWKFKPKELER